MNRKSRDWFFNTQKDPGFLSLALLPQKLRDLVCVLCGANGFSLGPGFCLSQKSLFSVCPSLRPSATSVVKNEFAFVLDPHKKRSSLRSPAPSVVDALELAFDLTRKNSSVVQLLFPVMIRFCKMGMKTSANAAPIPVCAMSVMNSTGATFQP